MNMERIEQIAYDAMANRIEPRVREPGWFYYHGRRTGKIALWLCDQLDVDVNRDIVHVGALFHDVGKGTEPHNEIGAEVTRSLIGEWCTAGELDGICEIILGHNQRNHTKARSLPVRIVQDADLIDHVGPIVPWLTFYWSGTHNETFHDHVRFICGEENAAYRKKMRADLNFEVSRRVYDERVAFEDQFFAEFRRVYMHGI
jgi:uncharacterized protein